MAHQGLVAILVIVAEMGQMVQAEFQDIQAIQEVAYQDIQVTLEAV